jgi:hypothetical protein
MYVVLEEFLTSGCGSFIVRDSSDPSREIVDGAGLIAARGRMNLGRELMQAVQDNHSRRGWRPVSEREGSKL